MLVPSACLRSSSVLRLLNRLATRQACANAHPSTRPKLTAPRSALGHGTKNRRAYKRPSLDAERSATVMHKKGFFFEP